MKQVLTLVMRRLGHTHFTGVMIPFHKDPEAYKRSTEVTDLDFSVARFATELCDTRMLGLNADRAPYFHKERLAMSLRHIIHLEELG
ncbi:hypothetical protein A1O7_02378 [Cladophialophora yegresii CBS 114405]|uniref:Uncharacterized protein n=1 Tax=Cladophialophora yegresii CBS 114405 TaxID=1182544 RepID=W9WBK4_9EURO|nr:uncharacterized protein A1O7_02378 [Cladophialophora yegresii CBS 114405]EXJ61946.1 hypothetical protein A1O7_02378 [Cladophialophora yegresii CBS 114405]